MSGHMNDQGQRCGDVGSHRYLPRPSAARAGHCYQPSTPPGGTKRIGILTAEDQGAPSIPQVPGVVFRLLGMRMAAYRFPRLRRADPHPFGLAAPRLDPVMLGGESWDRRGLIDVTLVYGDPLEVLTAAGQHRRRLPPQRGLARHTA